MIHSNKHVFLNWFSLEITLSISQQPLKQLEKPWHIPQNRKEECLRSTRKLTHFQTPQLSACSMFHLSTWGGFCHLLPIFWKWKSTLSSHGLMGTPAPPQAEPNTWDQLCFQPLTESGLCGQNAWAHPPTLLVGVWAGTAATESSVEVPQNTTDSVARGSRMAQVIKNLTAMWESLGSIPWVPSLVREDPLEKGMATHSSILAWVIPWTKEPDRPQVARSWTWLSN